MAKEKTKKEEKKESAVVSKYPSVLIRQRVTEKATMMEQSGAYVFEIGEQTNKKEVIKAVKDIHKVTPVKVNIVRNPTKKIYLRGKASLRGGVKKAYVFLKEGDKIK